MNKEYLKNKKYTYISESMFQIQEEERKRISRDLHDSTLQDLTYISHRLELLGLDIMKNPEKAYSDLDDIRNLLKNSMNNIRNIIFDLRPTVIDDLGLKESLLVFFDWLKSNSKINYIFEIDSFEASNFILLNIYRIIVECVLNSMKYSECTEVVVKCFKEKEHIELYIEDNGKGFDFQNSQNTRLKYGMSIVNERVHIMDGEISYNVSEGIGSKIYIYIPFNS